MSRPSHSIPESDTTEAASIRPAASHGWPADGVNAEPSERLPDLQPSGGTRRKSYVSFFGTGSVLVDALHGVVLQSIDVGVVPSCPASRHE
jgi:hypothetical protein